MDIARALASGKPLTGIANTWVSTGETGLPGESGVVKAPKRDLIHDLDTVPLPDWRLFPKEHYEKSYIRTVMGGGVELVAAIEGSRGCPFTCTYCSNTTLMEDYRGHGRWRREKSPERIVDELDAFRREFGGLDFVYWVDEIFLTGVERLKRFRDLYRDRIGAPFSARSASRKRKWRSSPRPGFTTSPSGWRAVTKRCERSFSTGRRHATFWSDR